MDPRRAPSRRRQIITTMLLMEMNLLLGPLSLAVLCGAALFSVMGFPHGLQLVAFPLAGGDVDTLALIALLPPSWLALRESWTLGICTVRRERYHFGAAFWLALAASAAAAALYARYLGPLPLYGLVPLWLFVAHMALLQRLRSSTRSAS